MIITELKSGRQVNSVPCVSLALGNFDGVHRGHREVIGAAVEHAKKTDIKSAVWCFGNNPKAQGEILSDTEEKTEIFRTLGADYVIFEDFEAVRNMSCEKFTEEYLAGFNVRALFCGFNFRFGRGASGDVSTLRGLCGISGIFCRSLDAVSCDGVPVSSSAIRSLIKEGDVEKAEALLTRPYCLTAEITHGRHLGAALGFPTINQNFENGKLVPRCGVYATLTHVDGEVYPSVSNVGARPTVNGKHLRLETHILDFDKDLYGKKIKVEFKKFLRNETKFSSEEQLKAAVLEDICDTKEYFSEKEDV